MCPIDSQSLKKKILLGLVAAMLIFAGLAILNIGIRSYSESVNSRAWPSTNGVVTKSRVKRIGSSSRDETPSYRAVVEYRYKVSNQFFTSNRIRIEPTAAINARQFANKMVAIYTAGRQIQVYYNPEDPASAVLEQGLFGTTFGHFFGALLFIPAGVFLARLLILEIRHPGSIFSV